MMADAAATLNAKAQLPVKLPAWRARLVLILLLTVFLVLIGRAVFLQGVNKNFLRQKGEARYSRVITLNASRGKIMDRNGEALAVSSPVESVAVSPRDVEASPQQLASLGKLLSVPQSELKKKLEEKRDFVYLRRQLSPEVAEKVLKLDISGLFLQREFRRFYPDHAVTAHLLGFTDLDDKGQEGVELAFNDQLAGANGSRRVLKDRLGNIIEGVESIRTPREGQDITLSIDRNIQWLAFRELTAAVNENRARAGAAVVLDARTGEILALVNQPTYNPNDRGTKNMSANVMRNRVVTDTFEPGSTMKPFTAAFAIESGRFKPDTPINTEGGHFSIGPATIHDAHPGGVLTVAQVIQKSSNVGAAKMALTLPPEYMYSKFAKLGFGKAPQIGFPGEATGRLRPYQTWRPIEQATMSYGHGISVSLLQLARAYTVFTSDGEFRRLSLQKTSEPEPSERVFSASTALAVRKMLETVTQSGGTAPRAQVLGYRVGGKTGTAHKLDAHGNYSDRYVASFVGFAPASDPRVIIAVMIDEPSAGQYYGGTVAAPVFSRIMGGVLRMLAIQPDAPTQNMLVPPGEVVEVREET